MGMSGVRSPFGGNAFRSSAIGTSTVRSANAFAPGVSPGFRGGDFHHGFRHGRGFGVGAFGVGLGLGLYGPGYYDDYYGYPDYGYYDAYYGDGGCYLVHRRVLTPYGWRFRRVQVCD